MLPVGRADSRYAKGTETRTVSFYETHAAVRGFCFVTSPCIVRRSHLTKAANSSVYSANWYCERDRSFSITAVGTADLLFLGICGMIEGTVKSKEKTVCLNC